MEQMKQSVIDPQRAQPIFMSSVVTSMMVMIKTCFNCEMLEISRRQYTLFLSRTNTSISMIYLTLRHLLYRERSMGKNRSGQSITLGYLCHY
jgi:hypothetical protein